MTATAQITVQEISNALLVPNAALRYSPPAEAKQESFSLSRLFLPRLPRGGRAAKKEAVAGERVVWMLKDKAPVSLSITTGASDGKMTEVIMGELDTNTLLITAAKKGGK
jgi:HlyD family secretion protein